MIRVAVVGTSGAGKSTFASRLAASIGVAHIELDAINWQAGWRGLDREDPVEFRRRVIAAIASESWVSDGNYSEVRGVVLERATHLVWLDYSRLVVMRRVVWRSLMRAVTRTELWPGTGNTERFAQWFEKDHPIRWAWNTHERRRREYTRLLEAPCLSEVQTFHVRRPRDLPSVESELILQGSECFRRTTNAS
jgi:adenylate kinase family enzyme